MPYFVRQLEDGVEAHLGPHATEAVAQEMLKALAEARPSADLSVIEAEVNPDSLKPVPVAIVSTSSGLVEVSSDGSKRPL